MLIIIYLLPAVVANFRGHQHLMPIFLLNLLLGWTILGWVGALVWSAMPVPTTTTADKPLTGRYVTTVYKK
jgi:hypothetical protein